LLYTVGLIGRRIGQFVDRRRAEQELQEAEERLRLATEAGRVGLLDWDVLADESRCSDVIAEIFGYPPGEFNPSYEGLLERVHPDDRGRVRRTLDTAIAGGESHELEFRIVRPAGDVRWVHFKGRVHRDERGTPARVVGVSIDITERKLAEQERKRLHTLEVGIHAEAAERERISRELHDRVAHSMGVAHQSLQLYEALEEKDPVRAHGTGDDEDRARADQEPLDGAPALGDGERPRSSIAGSPGGRRARRHQRRALRLGSRVAAL
jgi:PAS domain S-box-containing protein